MIQDTTGNDPSRSKSILALAFNLLILKDLTNFVKAPVVLLFVDRIYKIVNWSGFDSWCASIDNHIC